MALFWGSLWAIHMPAPLHASSLPLFIQELSVYAVIASCGRLIPQVWSCQVAGMSEMCLGSVKILKQSARFELVVVEGLNVRAPPSCWAIWFFSMRLLVSVRLSAGCVWVGFTLGISHSRCLLASRAHLCGSMQLI